MIAEELIMSYMSPRCNKEDFKPELQPIFEQYLHALIEIMRGGSFYIENNHQYIMADCKILFTHLVELNNSPDKFDKVWKFEKLGFTGLYYLMDFFGLDSENFSNFANQERDLNAKLKVAHLTNYCKTLQK